MHCCFFFQTPILKNWLQIVVKAGAIVFDALHQLLYMLHSDVVLVAKFANTICSDVFTAALSCREKDAPQLLAHDVEPEDRFISITNSKATDNMARASKPWYWLSYVESYRAMVFAHCPSICTKQSSTVVWLTNPSGAEGGIYQEK